METKPTYEELEQKVENQKKRIKDQIIAIDRHKKYKLILFEIYKKLYHSKYNGVKEVSEVVSLLTDTLFGVSKKKGGTRSKGTIKKSVGKMLKKYYPLKS